MGEDYIPYRAITTGGDGEIEEKKSRFIAAIRPAKTEGEALACLEAVKKKYWDARHHCFAYIIGSKAQIVRCSDDGEPSGTAGRPMLEVLLGSELRDTVAVVSRYFGGTLLGTGGLVRAYTQAVQAGLADSRISVMRYGSKLGIKTDYNGIGRIQYLMRQGNLAPIDTVYEQEVCLHVMVPWEKKDEFCKAVTEATGGRAEIEEQDRYYFIDKQE